LQQQGELPHCPPCPALHSQGVHTHMHTLGSLGGLGTLATSIPISITSCKVLKP
jgi:hypothetical protein